MGETGKKAGMKGKLCGMVADVGFALTVAGRRSIMCFFACSCVVLWDCD